MKVCTTCNTTFDQGEAFCPRDGTRLLSPSKFVEREIDPSDPLVGVVLNDRYQIIRRIGEGGMGIVYEARHVVLEKPVALKVLREDFSRRAEVVERFRQEARSASKIGHAHIIDVLDFGETPRGANYFVMEMLQGEDLANVLARDRRLTAARAVHIALQCCKALGAAHAMGIVHRDMKPENIFLTTKDGQREFVKIVDFGIAKISATGPLGTGGRKLTRTGMIFGTPEYMSPEQSAGKPADHRVDIYAIGIMLFEMLTARVPFLADTFMGILAKHQNEIPPTMQSIFPQLDIPEALDRVIMKALTKDPDARYQNMDEFGRELAAAMNMPWSLPAQFVEPHVSPVTTPLMGNPSTPGNISRSTTNDTTLSLRQTTADFTPTLKKTTNHTWMFIAAALAAALASLGVWLLVSQRSVSQQTVASAQPPSTPITIQPTPEPPRPLVVQDAAQGLAPKENQTVTAPQTLPNPPSTGAQHPTMTKPNSKPTVIKRKRSPFEPPPGLAVPSWPGPQ